MTRPTGLLIAVLCAAAVGCGDTSGDEALFAEWPSGRLQDGGTFTGVRLADSGAQSQDGGKVEASPGQGSSNKGGKKGGPKGVGGNTANEVGFSPGAMASEAVATWQAGIPPTDNAAPSSPGQSSEPAPSQPSDLGAGSDQGSSGSNAEPGDSGDDGGPANGHGKGKGKGDKNKGKGKHGKD